MYVYIYTVYCILVVGCMVSKYLTVTFVTNTIGVVFSAWTLFMQIFRGR